MPDVTRRHFVRQACCAAVGTTGFLSALAQLRMIGAVTSPGPADPARAAAHPADYKALVCLFLSGGNDGNSTVVPTDTASYAAYTQARSALAVPAAQLLPLTPARYNDGRRYALHPSLAGLHGLFGQGKVAVLANVGTLVQPTTLADYRAGRALPLQLFSHSDQVMQWQSSLPDRRSETGWGGRLADLIDALNTNNQISMSVSTAGTNTFQIGTRVAQIALYGGPGFPAFNVGGGTLFQARNAALRAAFATPQSNLFAAAHANITRTAIADSELLATVTQTAPALATVFPGSSTGQQLAKVAQLISVAPALGLKRQIFFVGVNGFDLHGGQATGHAPLLTEFSAAMKSFYDATVELGIANQVTSFTASDFGRTLVPNAGGTDHAWGNVQFVMGGAVKGGDIYGTMHNPTVNGPDDVGRGRWIPTTSIDEYNATLATWFGVSAANLSTVLPNIGRFAKPNLGFMA